MRKGSWWRRTLAAAAIVVGSLGTGGPLGAADSALLGSARADVPSAREDKLSTASTVVVTEPQASADLDAAGLVWAGAAEGVLKLLAKDGTILSQLPALTDVKALAADVDRRLLWVARGIDLQVTTYAGLPVFNLPGIGAATGPGLILDPGDGSVWLTVGTKARRYSTTGQLLLTVTHTATITAAALDWANDALWLASEATSISVYDASNGTVIRQVGTGKNQNVYDIAFADYPAPYLYVGTSKGLQFYQVDGTLISSDTLNNTRQVARPRFGVYATTSGTAGEVFSLEGSVFAAVDAFPGQATIVSLVPDPEFDAVWVAAADGRIARVEGTSFTPVVTKLWQFSPAVGLRDLAYSPPERSTPTVTVESPLANEYVSVRPQIALRYDDVGSGVDPSTVGITFSGAQVTSTCVAGAQTATCVPTVDLSPTTYQVSAHVTDYAGNSKTSTAVSFQVDGTAPTLSFASPTAGQTVASKPELRLSYFEEGSGISSSSLLLYANGTPLTATCTFGANTATCTPSSQLSDGPTALTAILADRVGNRSATARVDVTVTSGPDTTPPAAQITSPTAGSILLSRRPAVTVAFSDVGTGVVAGSAAFTVNGATVAFTCSGSGGTSGAFSCSPAADLPYGQISLSATVADAAGNGSSPAVVAFTVSDVRTTVRGFVVRGGSPVSGAEVDVLGKRGATTVSAADGSFSIAGVVVNQGEQLTVVARATVGGTAHAASRAGLPAQQGAFTEAGTLELVPLCNFVTQTFVVPPGIQGRVYAMAVFDDGSGPALFVGGTFTTIAGRPMAYVAKWNGTTWSAVGGGTNGWVNDLVVFNDGSGPALFAGGSFSIAGGVPAARIARWNGTAWAPVGTGFNSGVNALTVHQDATGTALYAGGDFTHANVGPSQTLVNGVARWNGSSWVALKNGLGAVESLESLGSGTSRALYAGLRSGSVGIRKWDGSRWTTIGRDLDEVVAIGLYNDGSGSALYVANRYADPATGYRVTALLKQVGSGWQTLTPLGGESGTVQFLVFDDGNGPKLFVAGGSNNYSWDGTTLQGQANDDGFALAVFDDGTGPHLFLGSDGLRQTQFPLDNLLSDGLFKLDHGVWVPHGGGHVNQGVRALAVFDDGDGPALFVGGAFSIAGVAARHVARWDGHQWSALGDGLAGDVYSLAVFDDGGGPHLYAGHANGVSVWRRDSGWSLLSGPSDQGVLALAVLDEGEGDRLFAGGFFTAIGGIPARGLARWNGSLWTPVGSGVNDATFVVMALSPHVSSSGSELIAAGSFTGVGGVSARNIAAWDGHQWRALGVGLPNRVAAVASVAIAGVDGLVAAGWDVTGLNGSTRGFVSLWNGSGWTRLGPEFRDGTSVYALSVFDDGTGSALYAGGAIQAVSGGSINGLARWDGSAWVSPGLALNSPGAVFTLASFDDEHQIYPESLYVGGSFTGVNGSYSWNLFSRGRRCPADTTPPTITLTSPAQGLVTAATEVTFRGSLSEPATLTLNGNAVNVAPNLSFEQANVPLSPGTNAFQLVARDAAGNTGTRNVSVLRDATPPQIAFTAPSNGQIVSTRRPELVLAYSDVGSGVVTSTLSLSANSTPIALTCTHGSGQAHCSPVQNLTPGSVALAATIADGVGNVSAPAQVIFTISGDFDPPSLTITSPTAGADLNTRFPHLVFAYSDVGTGVATPTLVVKVNGSLIGVSCTFQAASASCSPTQPIAEGQVSVAATINDVAGNQSAIATVSFRITLGPISIDSPTEDQVLTSNTPTVALTYSSSSIPTTLALHVSPVDVGFSCSYGDNEMLCTPASPFAEGRTTLTATMQNGAGQTSPPATVGFWVDTLPPTLSFVSPLPGSTVRANRPQLRLATTDAGMGLDTASLVIREGQAPVAVSCSFDATGATCMPTTTMAAGTHNLTATISDRSGKSSSATISFILDTSDRTPPVINVAAPAVTNQLQLVVTGSIDEPASLTVNGSAVAVSPGLTFAHGPVSLVEGSNAFHLAAIDQTDNLGTRDVTVVRDTVAPTLAFESPVQGGFCNSSQTLQLSWADAASGVDPSTLAITVNGQAFRTSCESSASGATCPVGSLPTGTVALTAAVRDLAGNASNIATVSCTTDPALAPPAITVFSPAPNSSVSTPEILIVGGLSKQAALQINGQPVSVAPDLSFQAGPYALSAGPNTFSLDAQDSGGRAAHLALTVTRDTSAPGTVNLSLVTLSEIGPGLQRLVGAAGAVDGSEPGTAVAVHNPGAGSRFAIAVAPNGSFEVTIGALDGDTLSLTSRDAAGNESAPGYLQVHGTVPVAADPSAQAPPLASSPSMDICGLVGFFWSAASPVQFGVQQETVDCSRLAVVRGRVLDRVGAPIAGVRVRAVGDPDHGFTATRADGAYDFAVRAGDQVVLSFGKAGYFTSTRSVQLLPQEFSTLDDVLMVSPDSQVTTIDASGGTGMQVARGSSVSDGAGSRQTTILFPPNTTATMRLPDGGSQVLTSLQVRATELSTGLRALKALSATPSPEIDPAFAVELSVDAAESAGGSVDFSRDLAVHVENVRNLPVGTDLPVMSFDRPTTSWIPAPNGRVIKVLSVTSGMADLDVTGSGQAASAAELQTLGIDDAERSQLATLYPPGQSLVRFVVSHFSLWMLGPTSRPLHLRVLPPYGGSERELDHPGVTLFGGVIETDNQVLTESLGIVGSPLTLNYRSDEVPGRKAAYRLTIHLVGTSGQVPPSVDRVDLAIDIAGQHVTRSFQPAPNLSYEFLWDRREGFGREIEGQAPWTVTVDYVELGSGRTSRYKYAGQLGTLDAASAVGLGGWTIAAHHFFDKPNGTLYYGDGRRRTLRSAANNPLALERVAGTGFDGSSGDGGDPRSARLKGPAGLSVMKDGSLLIADFVACRIRKISAKDGKISTLAGSVCPTTGSSSGDGGPPRSAILDGPMKAVEGLDGSIYVVEYNGNRIRRVDLDRNVITTVAGTGESGCGSEQLARPVDIARAPDGGLLIANQGHFGTGLECSPIKKHTPGAGLRTISDVFWSPGYSGPGFFTTQPQGVAVGPDGSAYWTPMTALVKRSPGGAFDPHYPGGLVAGHAGPYVNGNEQVFAGDGLPASTANTRFLLPGHLAVASDGTIYIADQQNMRIRRISPSQRVDTIAGGGWAVPSGDGMAATSAFLASPTGIALDEENGVLYFAVEEARMVFKIRLGEPKEGDEIVVPEEDGSVRYVFDQQGHHLRTEDPITDKVLLRFSYQDFTGPGGGVRHLLTQIEDPFNNATQITRSSNGDASAIVGPYGQTTTLELNPTSGYLSEVSGGGTSVRLTHDNDGLLRELIDPRSGTYQFDYDPEGRLSRVADPAAGTLDLTYTESPSNSGWKVQQRTTMGRTSQVEVFLPPDDPNVTTPLGSDELMRRIFTDSAGLETVLKERKDGRVSGTAPGGTTATSVFAPDPLLEDLAPYAQIASFTTPSGTQALVSTDRPQGNALGQNWSESSTWNGRSTSVEYQKGTRTVTHTSAENRQSTALLDGFGRLVQSFVPGITAVDSSYDGRGRLWTTGQGARRTTFAYDPQGFIQSIMDPLTRTVSFARDAHGRVTTQTLPDTRQIGFGYDTSGNLTSLTPPSRPAHAFGYNPVDQLETTTPPAIGQGSSQSRYDYNADHQLELITRPDGQTIDPAYDPSTGRLSSLTTPTGTTSFTYNGASGSLESMSATGGAGTITYDYDGPLLRSVAQSGSVNGSVSYGRDANFWINSRTINGDSSSAVAYDYDKDGLLKSAGALAISRDAGNGLVTSTSLYQTGETFERNGFGDVTRLRSGFSGPGCTPGPPPFAGCTIVLDQTFVRDAAGRITGMTETLQNPLSSTSETHAYDYTFDTAGRLTEVKKDNVIWESYGYDANSNRTSWSDPWGTSTATYDAQDRLLTYGNKSYAYTANGELLTKTQAGQTAQYTYDVLGNLRRVELADGTAIDYVVDAANRRITKKVGGVQVKGFLYGAGAAAVAELDGNGAVLATFVYATGGNVPDAMVRGGVTYRIVTDHLGSVRWVLDAQTGAVAQRMEYDPFGRVTLDTNPGFQPFGFAGGLYDYQTGLVRFGARDYDAETGRWTSKDPIGFGGGDSNLYAYVEGDPVNYSDPSGLAVGHHYVPKIVRGLPGLSAEAATVFSQTTTGPLDQPNLNQPGYNRTHIAYDRAVRGAYDNFITANSIDPAKMTAEQAKAFIGEVRASQVPAIRTFLNDVEAAAASYASRAAAAEARATAMTATRGVRSGLGKALPWLAVITTILDIWNYQQEVEACEEAQKYDWCACRSSCT